MSKRSFVVSLIGACAALSVLVIPAAASASALWVSNTTSVSSPRNSCIHPGYSTIQAAVEADSSAATIHVCPGSYVEQLTITAPLKLVAVDGVGSAKVVLPAAPTDSITQCDQATGTGRYEPDQDLVSICTSGTVAITGLSFEPKWPGSPCDDSLYGILVAGGATLDATNVAVDGGGAFPLNGCQGGVAIQVGMAWTSPVEVGHATLMHDTVSQYQKNGITVDGAGSSAKITTTVVSGAGPTPETAQNGIQVSNGALATITSSSISGNECDHSSCGANGEQAAGVLFYGAARGSKLTASSVNENDMGVYYLSESESQPAAPEVSIANDVLRADRYEGVVLDQGDASLSGDTITGPGILGIDLLQYEGQVYGVKSTASKATIEGMSGASVEVESDNKAADKPGAFTISSSSITNDDFQSIVNQSTTFTVLS